MTPETHGRAQYGHDHDRVVKWQNVLKQAVVPTCPKIEAVAVCQAVPSPDLQQGRLRRPQPTRLSPKLTG